MTIPGTPRCERIKDPSPIGPFTAACGCGWSLSGRKSQRDATHEFHRHVRFVRAGAMR